MVLTGGNVINVVIKCVVLSTHYSGTGEVARIPLQLVPTLLVALYDAHNAAYDIGRQ